VRVSQANAKDGSNPSDQVTGELDRLATQLAGLKRVWEQDRRAVDAVVGDSKRGKNASAAQTLDQAVRADAEAEALALATATEKERTKVRAEMKEKQVKEAGELERKIEEAKIEKLRATKLAEADRIQTDAGITTQKGKDVVAEGKAKASSGVPPLGGASVSTCARCGASAFKSSAMDWTALCASSATFAVPANRVRSSDSSRTSFAPSRPAR